MENFFMIMVYLHIKDNGTKISFMEEAKSTTTVQLNLDNPLTSEPSKTTNPSGNSTMVYIIIFR